MKKIKTFSMWILTIAFAFNLLVFSSNANALRTFAVYVDGIYWGTVEGELFGDTLWIWGMMSNGGSASDQTIPVGSEVLALNYPAGKITATDRTPIDEVIKSALNELPDGVGSGSVDPKMGSAYKLLVFLPEGSLASMTRDGVISKDEVIFSEKVGAALVFTGQEEAGKAYSAVVVDGVTYSPAQFNDRFSRTTLYSAINTTDDSVIPTMYSFTSREGLERFAGRLPKSGSLPEARAMGGIMSKEYSSAVERMASCKSFTRLFEHKNCNGAEFTAQVGWGYNFAGPFSWWNDRVSSLRTANNGSWTVLHQHSNWTGNQLWIQHTCLRIKKLSNYGWNDVASSVDVF
ncbi:MAG: hypothetical protein MUF43_08245 [Flavobacterium sp.]|nr:hypothetical protein [Flavobacterium sp.]